MSRPKIIITDDDLSNSAQIWICPANKKNLAISISNKFVFNNGLEEYAWAFNENFKKKWIKLNIGDICIFGNSGDGFKHLAVVKSKIDFKGDGNWPFKSPSGKAWRWGFTLTRLSPINLSSKDFKDAGLNGWPTQNMLTEDISRHIKIKLNI
jgi:hypothetical protein